MDPTTIREALRDALGGFAGETSLRDWTTVLLEVLGYRSERVQDVGSPVEFMDLLEESGPLPLTEKQREQFDHWQTVDIVFQITDDEIGKQTSSFRKSGFDRGRIQSFVFLAVELEDVSYNRMFLAETTRTVNRRLPMPVIILFRHGSTLTLSIIHRRVHKADEDRDVLEKVTQIKDIQIDEPHRAHIDILSELALPRLIDTGVRDFDGLHAAWERTLDIEGLNRRFYGDLFRWFERAAKECCFPDDGAGGGNLERHVIRLITRLLFIWFLKEKGLVPEQLFDDDFARGALKFHGPDKTDYYRAVLQNLFFATLNTEIDKRSFSEKTASAHRDFSKYRYHGLLTDPDTFLDMLKSVPFVNGGLFDCLDDFTGTRADGRRIDAFTDDIATQGTELDVPARLFMDQEEGLFPLFRRYKFTVEENTPLDREVALDPELLGRVFENLLAAYNPETRENARRTTGSYYTPRHVVDYMIHETLARALTENSRPADENMEFWEDRLRYLLDPEDAFDDAWDLFYSQERESAVQAIARLRVLDPAVGSGAFPMGALHKLTMALRRLDPDNKLWEQLQKERASARASAAFNVRDEKSRDEELLDISRIFETYRDSDFGRKLYLIQNGIFGVDIQPIACQIAKLRFFISLVVEQETNKDPGDNYGIRPLPNLETRFVAADTLIGLGGHKMRVLGDQILGTMEERLRKVREGYFNARTRQEKLRLRAADDNLRAELASELEGLGLGHDNAEAVAEWDPYDQNTHAVWFDPEWMFGVSNGFDVVIGNPPYIRGENIPNKAKLPAEFGDFYKGTADIYTYFFYKGVVEHLREGGLLCFITSNKFMRADYGESLRKFLRTTAPPVLFLDLGRTGTFDATVRPSVLLARKGGSHKTLRAGTVRDTSGMTNPGKFMQESGFDLSMADMRDTGWSIAKKDLLSLRDRIEGIGTPLREFLKSGLYRGILTGLNDAFIIDEETRARLIDEDPNCKNLIRPWLRGRDIRRWRTELSNCFVIAIASSANVLWPWSEEEIEAKAVAIFEETYPSIRSHLSKFESRLRKRHDQGKYFWELRSCTYYEAFDRPKIIYSNLAKEMRAVIDRMGLLTNQKCYIIPDDDSFLLALLNSKVLDFYFRLAMPCLDDPFNGGDMEFSGVFMQRVPIAPAKPKTRKYLSRLAGDIQSAKKADPDADVTSLEHRTDEIVYSLYGLDDKDVALIDEALLP